MGNAKKLGKGLKALISEDIELDGSREGEGTPEEAPANPLIFELEINKIKPNGGQPRKTFQKDGLEEMAVSIKEHGILQPLVVRPEGKGYIIIAGERRWRAAHLAGLKVVPVIVKDLPPKDVMEIALIENVQREDLNPIEEAMAYEKLMADYNLTQGEIGIRIGKSRAAVANTMRLLGLPETVRNAVLADKLTSGHARALLSLDSPETMETMAEKIIDEHLSVRDVEKMVKAEKNKREPRKVKIRESDPYLEDVEEKLKSRFQTGAAIHTKGQKGRIELEFYSMEDLNRLLALLEISGR